MRRVYACRSEASRVTRVLPHVDYADAAFITARLSAFADSGAPPHDYAAADTLIPCHAMILFAMYTRWMHEYFQCCAP